MGRSTTTGGVNFYGFNWLGRWRRWRGGGSFSSMGGALSMSPPLHRFVLLSAMLLGINRTITGALIIK